jgi:hypothetical protein
MLPLCGMRLLPPSSSGRWERRPAPPGVRQKPGSGPVCSLTLDGPIESRYQSPTVAGQRLAGATVGTGQTKLQGNQSGLIRRSNLKCMCLFVCGGTPECPYYGTLVLRAFLWTSPTIGGPSPLRVALPIPDCRGSGVHPRHHPRFAVPGIGGPPPLVSPVQMGGSVPWPHPSHAVRRNTGWSLSTHWQLEGALKQEQHVTQVHHTRIVILISVSQAAQCSHQLTG